MTILSNGGGQDTTYLIWRLIHDEEFYRRHIKPPLIVVGSDTGNEHRHTYDNVKLVERMCKTNFILYYWVTPDMGFHGKAWQSLHQQYQRNNTIGSAAYQQTCTDNLKVKVVDNFVEHWINKYMLGGANYKRKRAYYEYTKKKGEKIRLILGFAAKEESRTGNGSKFDAKWKRDNVERYYPLIIEGVDRQAAIDYNEANIPWKVWPSNCMTCFYSSDQEILWLYRFERKMFKKWVELEKAKLERDKDKPKNYGVYGKITLEQKLEKAQKLYGHWTDEQLYEYKYSHGHCIKSRY